MKTFFEIGGFSMYPVLLCGVAALLVALYATGRPAKHLIVLAERLGWAEVFFALSGFLSNLAMVFYTVGRPEHEGDGFAKMLVTGLYESTAPAIMGLSFLALVHLALAIAGYRLAKREP
jgi:hypothetical protein